MGGKALPVGIADASPPSLDAENSYGPDDMTCAICLEQIQLDNTAYVKGCEHAYCGMSAASLYTSINLLFAHVQAVKHKFTYDNCHYHVQCGMAI